MAYQPPQWSRPPPSQSAWSIDEIKSGVLLASHPLRLRCTTFGRAADQVTVPTAHESCSRVHARIAFDSTGTPWLRDLGSGNGSTVNGRRLPPLSVGRDESDGRAEGSRGVIVYPGDAIRFGASTRMFCLNGPQEFDRGAVKARLAQAKASRCAAKTDVQKTDEEDGGVSWGMDADPAENDTSAADDDDAEWSTRPIQEADVPDKHRKLYERLLAKRYKIDNVRMETERIEAKGAFGDLTEGQAARMEQNKRKEEELRGQMEDLERELREKNWGSKRSGGVTSKRKMEPGDDLEGDEDDVDDFYDRTADTMKKSRTHNRGEKEGETEQSLTTKWRDLVALLRKRRGDAAILKGTVENLKTKIVAIGESDEDAFFLNNDLQIAQDNFDKAADSIRELEDELADTEKLLRVVNDKIVFDRSIGFVGLESDHPRSMKVGEVSKGSEKSVTDIGTTMPPPQPLSRANGPSVVSGPTMMPPPPRPRVPSGPIPLPSGGAEKVVPKTPAAAATDGSSVPATSVIPSGPMPPPPKRRAVGPAPPPGGTLAAIRSAAPGPSTAKVSVVKGPRKTPAGAGGAFNTKEDTWKAPEGQDGSGRTKLNAKFAGRY